jgi:predicted outer membrane repeat protein
MAWGLRLVVSGVLALALLGLAGAATGRVALAATLSVTATGDDGPGTLREAVARAAAGDTITFAFPAGAPGCAGSACTITLTSGTLNINKSLAIIGPGASRLTIKRSSAAGTPQFRVVAVPAAATVTLSGVTVSNGFADEGDGLITGGRSGLGVFNAGTMTLTDSIVSGNQGLDWVNSNGGGICNTGTMTIVRTIIRDNVSASVGGGICTWGPLTIRDSLISNNRSTGGRGGGIFVNADTTISGSTFDGNSAFNDLLTDAGGGAIYAQSGTLRLHNSTVSNNSTNRVGGALQSNFWASMDVSNVTFSNNAATAEGGAFANTSEDGTITVRNSIVVRATGPSGGQNCVGVVVLAGNNLSDDGSCSMTAGNPRLGALQDNGGFAPTHRLEAGSAAIDAGDPNGCKGGDGQALAADERGAPRPQGTRCDLGAYESQGGTPGSAPPTITGLPDLAVLENVSTGALPIQVFDADTPAASAALSVAAVSDNQALVPNGNIVVAPASGPAGQRLVSATPAPHENGVARITLTVTDDNGKTAATVWTLTVAPVNDRPAFVNPGSVTVVEDSPAFRQPGWATAISAGPPNESTQALTFAVVTSAPYLFSVQPAISSDGTLTFTPAPNANGTTSELVTLQDDGGTANGGFNTSLQQSFTITVSGVNDRPSFVKGPDVAVAVNSGPYSQPWASAISAGPDNEGSQALTFQAGASDPGLFSVQPSISSAGILSFTPAPNAVGSVTVSVVLKDDGGTADGGIDTAPPSTFTIALGSPPTATATSTATPTATGMPTASVTPSPSSTPSSTASPTVTVTPAASQTPTPTASATPSAPCAPRPNPTLQMEQIGPGRLRVIVTAQTNAGLTTNALARLTFGEARNARVEVPGAAPGTPGGPAIGPGQPAGTPGNFSLALPANTQQASFVVQRVASGDFRVDLVVEDACQSSGPFRTFVGGGLGVQ